MTDKPIIFSGPMIRALLDERKTQTRRVLKPQPEPDTRNPDWWKWTGKQNAFSGCTTDQVIRHGVKSGMTPIIVGDRLWVREAWTTGAHLDQTSPRNIRKEQSIGYLADEHEGPWLGRKRPSIYMPRWASRITLPVTDVRVQRLQDISEADAVAEGIQLDLETGAFWGAEGCGVGGATRRYDLATDAFRDLWDSLHGADAWAANPWVAPYTFTVQRGNIDEVGL
jgi:hypothetical protein